MEAKQTLERIRKFKYLLVLEGLAIGLVSGFAVSLFRLLIGWGESLRGIMTNNLTWMTVCFFVCMYLMVCLGLKFEPMCSGSGIPQVKGELAGQMKANSLKVLIAKILGGAAAISAGLSVGREGPSVQIGAMCGKIFSRLTNRLTTEQRLLITVGSGAGLSAAFNAPLAGVVFSLEEIHKNLSMELMLASMSACISSDFVSSYIFGLEPVFAIEPSSILPLTSYWLLIIFGLILGLFGVFYNMTIKAVQKAYSYIKWMPVKVAIPVAISAVLAFYYPQVLGGGNHLIDELGSLNWGLKALIVLLVVKFVFSMISFGSGSPGGIFLPLLVIGGVTGSVFATATGNEQYIENFVILGMAGYFAAIVRSPLTGIILISEMTGSLSHLLSLSLVSLIAYTVADVLKAQPIYDQLLEAMLKRKPKPTHREIIFESFVQVGSFMDQRKIAELHMPAGSLVISIQRGEIEIVPSGDTILKADDKLLILCNESNMYKVEKLLASYAEQCAN